MSYIIRVTFTFLLLALFDSGFGDFVHVTFDTVKFGENPVVVSSSVCGQSSSTSRDIVSPREIDVISFPHTGCKKYPNENIKLIQNNALFILRGNCPFNAKIIQAESANAKLLLVASSTPLPILDLNRTSADTFNMPMYIVPWSAFEFVSVTDYSTVSITPLQTPVFNYNKILLLFIALLPLLIGSLLGGSPLEFLKYGLLLRKGEVNQNNFDAFGQDEEGDAANGRLSQVFYIIFPLGIMVTFLLGLYFFYNYFVWLSITIFCFSSSLSIYSFFSPFCVQIPLLSCRLPANSFPVLRYRPDPKFFLLLASSAILPALWLVYRQSDNAWILQDILGFFLIVYILNTLRFKTAIYFLIPLLCILVLYDVFFVFITPFFTADGRSVMEYVAFGPDNGSSKKIPKANQEVVVPSVFGASENIPFLFLVPHLTESAGEIVCQYPRLFVAGLGFGDVVLPGLYVTYCLYYDNIRKRKFKITFWVSFLSYVVSLILAFIASYVTKLGQPALLYLVPSILSATLLLAVVRRDLNDFLFGREIKSKMLLLNEAEYSSEDNTI